MVDWLLMPPAFSSAPDRVLSREDVRHVLHSHDMLTYNTALEVRVVGSESLDNCRTRAVTEPTLDSASDEHLVALVWSGSGSALDHLIRRYWPMLTSYGARVLNDWELAEDVVQKTFITLWRARAGAQPPAIRAYLFRVTRNLALDELRARKSRSLRERRSWSSWEINTRTPADVLHSETTARMVEDAIQRIPERRREAFTLAYMQGLSYSEVSEVMGISRKTVGHHVSAALAELRESLAPLLQDRTGRPR